MGALSFDAQMANGVKEIESEASHEQDMKQQKGIVFYVNAEANGNGKINAHQQFKQIPGTDVANPVRI